METNRAQPRGPGRPRQRELDQRLTSAANHVLSTYGISGLTVERICASAGVPKATFYRRWRKPIDCVAEGMLARPRQLEYVDSGDAAKDLSRFYVRLVEFYSDPIWLAWDGLIRCEPSVRSVLADELAREGLLRRKRNEQALGDALAKQHLGDAVDASLILNVLNGLARNASALGWHASDTHVQELVYRLTRRG